jgi:DNA repair protein RecO (recombination protein O)
MKQQTTPAIILRRTNYGEADRIITFLTPVGKVKAIVKGVRRSKSKLAGGIELFSENRITFLETRGDLARIVSTRLEVYWDGIITELQRMMFGYEAMKLIDKIIEDEADRSYYDLLKATLEALNSLDLPLAAVQVWFYARFLKLQGREPNLKTDHEGNKLADDMLYIFSVDDMCFIASAQGNFRPDHIKLLRLVLGHRVDVLRQIKDAGALCADLQPLMLQLLNHQV